jgi:hypothetical protein
VEGVVVRLAGHAHLSCLDPHRWIAVGVDMHSLIWFIAPTAGPCLQWGPAMTLTGPAY